MFNPQDAANKQYWQQLNPGLSITGEPLTGLKSPCEVDPSLLEKMTHQLIDEGYFKADSLVPESTVQPLAQGVTSVANTGYPPVFALVYDEFWRLLASLSQFIEPVLGKDYRLKLADPWIWYLDKGNAGFAPHRDLPMQVNHTDGKPAILNLWIPLTDATPLNGCIYVLPLLRDPNFPDKLENTDVGFRDLQNIRAVPAAAGSVMVWSPALLHWGARSSSRAESPRISIGVTFIRKDFKTPAADFGQDYSAGPEISLGELSNLSFRTRLEYIARIIWYFRTRVIEDYFDSSEALFEFCATYANTQQERTMIRKEARKMRAVTLWRRGHQHEGLSLLQQVNEHAPNDADVWIMLGRFHETLRKPDVAENCFRRALQLQPDNALIHVCLANTLFLNQRITDAIASYKTALSINPDLPDAHLGLAHASSSLGNRKEAIVSVRRTLELSPGHPDAITLLARLTAG